MLINQDFTVDRTKYLGGSDIGAILGLSKYRTPLAVWMEKTGREMKKHDSLAMRFGSFAEEFVASEYARSTNAELMHDQSAYIHPSYSFMCAHIDRFVLGNDKQKLPTKILECKTANAFARSDWGEIGSDEVPLAYLAQCAWYMAITGIEQTDLAVLFGNSEFRIYQIARDKELETLVIKKATKFWQEYVLGDIPPPVISEADCQVLFNQGDCEKKVEANPEIYALTKQLNALNIQVQQYEGEIAGIKQRLMETMGPAESLYYEGQLIATWRAPKPSFRLDATSIEKDHPGLCVQYRVPIKSNRRLVIKNI